MRYNIDLYLCAFPCLPVDRAYLKKKQIVERFIKKHGKVDHARILNEVNVDYDTLMRILAELKADGRIS